MCTFPEGVKYLQIKTGKYRLSLFAADNSTHPDRIIISFFRRPRIISEHRDGDERLRSVGGAPDSAESDVCFNPSLINPREREATATAAAAANASALLSLF